MRHDAECFTRHIRACNNAVLPGGRQRLRIGAAEVGWVRPEHAPRLPLPDCAAFDAYAAGLREAGAYASRDEAFAVHDDATGTAIATIDRGAIPILGIRASGVHVNGIVRRRDGLHLWIGRRSAHKKLEPGKLDHITAGGIGTGYDARGTLIKEAAEEASLPAALAQTAQHAATLSYAMDRLEGLRRDQLFCFDLILPEDVTPQPNDDEMAGFTLMPIAEAADRVATTDDFKFNVALVLIDLLLRTETINPTTPTGRLIAGEMRRVRS